jgi:hypothetical protein
MTKKYLFVVKFDVVWNLVVAGGKSDVVRAVNDVESFDKFLESTLDVAQKCLAGLGPTFEYERPLLAFDWNSIAKSQKLKNCFLFTKCPF